MDTFEEERLPVAAVTLKLTTKLLDKFQSAAKTLPDDSERFQLTLNYRTSSLSQQAVAHELLLQTGDRAPDSILQDSKGNTIRVFDLFRGPHFTVLIKGKNLREEIEKLIMRYHNLKLFTIVSKTEDRFADSFIDESGLFKQIYGEREDLIYVVRPDGYIAFIGDHDRWRECVEYLDQLLTRR